MRAMIQCMHENNYYNLAFPSKEKELQVLCDSLGIANIAKTLLLSTNSRYEHLYLPTEQSELNKALERLGVERLENIHWQVEEHNLPNNLEAIVIKNQTGIDSLNEFAAIFKELGQREVIALSELAAFAKISAAGELKTLASCMYEFETFPDIHTPEQYGRYIICESGHFEYGDCQHSCRLSQIY